MKLLEKGKIDTRKLRLWTKKKKLRDFLLMVAVGKDGWKIEAATSIFDLGSFSYTPRKNEHDT